MSDLLRRGNDLEFVNGDLCLVEDSREVAQRVKERLQSFAQEYFLNDEGLPYFDFLYDKNADVGHIKTFMTQTILLTQGVKTLDSLNLIYDTSTRRVFVTGEFTTVYNDNLRILSPVQTVVIPSEPVSSDVLDLLGIRIMDLTDETVMDLT